MTEATIEARKGWMSLLARSVPARLAELLPELPEHETLRSPEVGAVMVRGRVGGTGTAFNLGEMTVTRTAVRLACGTVGHAWVQGRDKRHATRAAVIDALMQTNRASALAADLMQVLATEALAAREARAGKAAATKVDFFTLVRGEDP